MINRLKLDLLVRECLIELYKEITSDETFNELKAYTLLQLLKTNITIYNRINENKYKEIVNKYIKENNMSKRQIDSFICQIDEEFHDKLTPF